MKSGVLFALATVLSLGVCALAQEPASLTPGQEQQEARAYGRGMGMGPGRGVMGTVTEVDADHFIVKNDQGETWTIHYSANTRVMKQLPRPANAQPRGQGQPEGQGEGSGFGMRGGNPPQPIKATDIKVGDAIMAMGDTDQTAKSVGAVMVMQLDPETAKRMEEMRANFGKTWLAGRVTAINETTVTIQGMADNAPHSFRADENTAFRKRRDPVTLADIQVGDMVRVDGSVKDGQFVATAVNVMGPQVMGGPARRPGPPPQ